jgi:GTPase
MRPATSFEDMCMQTKSGFVAVVGRPNAGKSTLLNDLVGEKLAMVSKKAQATRKRMQIIVMHGQAQIIFVDTPGIHHKERLLNQFMLDEALKAMGDCDVILFLAPASDSVVAYEKFLALPQSKKAKHLIVLTKIDRIPQAKLLEKLAEYQPYQGDFEAIIPYSVTKSVGKIQLLDLLAQQLPSSPYLYDPDDLTTETIREIYRELIREAIFERMSDELPYESDVLIERVSEEEKIDRVVATIVVEKESQKGMMIGQRGEGIKRIGKTARLLMEEFSHKQIFLDLMVSVRKGWSKHKEGLKAFGYHVE